MKKQDVAKKMIHGHEVVASKGASFTKNFIDYMSPNKKISERGSHKMSVQHHGGNAHNIKRDALIREKLQKGR